MLIFVCLKSYQAKMWIERVADPVAFAAALAKYPTLLMYSYGASARLEYFSYCNQGFKPDVAQARQLLMMSKKSLQFWGKVDRTSNLAEVPILRRGFLLGDKQRNDEKLKIAIERQNYTPIEPNETDFNSFWKEKFYQQMVLKGMKVDELRLLLRSMGGKPTTKRKYELIERIVELGYFDDNNIQRESELEIISYREWLILHLCHPKFKGLPESSIELLSNSFNMNEKIKALAGEYIFSNQDVLGNKHFVDFPPPANLLCIDSYR